MSVSSALKKDPKKDPSEPGVTLAGEAVRRKYPALKRTTATPRELPVRASFNDTPFFLLDKEGAMDRALRNGPKIKRAHEKRRGTAVWPD